MPRDVRSIVLLDTFSFFPPLFCTTATLGREEGEKFACAEFWVSFGKEETEGEGNGVQKRGSCFFAMGKSVANSYGALHYFGHGEKFFGEGSWVETGRV